MTTCATCCYSREHRDPAALVDLGRGPSFQCWRFPPVPVGGPSPQGLVVGTFRPIVAAGDVCGEWLPRHNAEN